MDSASTFGQTARSMRASGKKEPDMGKADLLIKKARVELEYGSMVKGKSGYLAL